MTSPCSVRRSTSSRAKTFGRETARVSLPSANCFRGNSTNAVRRTRGMKQPVVCGLLTSPIVSRQIACLLRRTATCRRCVPPRRRLRRSRALTTADRAASLHSSSGLRPLASALRRARLVAPALRRIASLSACRSRRYRCVPLRAVAHASRVPLLTSLTLVGRTHRDLRSLDFVRRTDFVGSEVLWTSIRPLFFFDIETSSRFAFASAAGRAVAPEPAPQRLASLRFALRAVCCSQTLRSVLRTS